MRVNQFKTKNDQEVTLGKFTVLVGPNNVGKSQTLRDIHSIMVKGKNSRPTLITTLQIAKPATFEDLLVDLEIVEHPQSVGYHVIRGLASNLISGADLNVRMDSLQTEFEKSSDLQFASGNILKFRVSYLDADSRLRVAQRGPSYNPHTEFPQNLLQALYDTTEAEVDLRKAFRETFDMDIRLDYSGLKEFAMRVASSFGEIPENPKEAYPIISKFHQLDEEGDGYKSFVGVVLSLLLSKNRIILLDEPEAFLHPAQARQLGYWIAEHSKLIPTQIIVATHNADFLAGILASDQAVDIYRLNRDGDTTIFNLISSEATASLAKSPLLSSQRVLGAIFHKGVVVCEADADRAVYQTVAAREYQALDVLFIHAHNKQTIPRVVSLLRDAAIPVRVVVDIDIVNASDTFLQTLQALDASIDTEKLERSRDAIALAIEGPDESKVLDELTEAVELFLSQLKQGAHTLSGARGAINRIRKEESSKWGQVKKQGIAGAPETVKIELESLIDAVKSHGLHIVSVGELEGWIDLGTRRKNRWVVLALEALHDNKCSSSLRTFIGEVLDDLN